MSAPEAANALTVHGTKPDCGKVWIDEGGEIRTVGLRCEGGCSVGCCSDYVCIACGKHFRVEWPD